VRLRRRTRPFARGPKHPLSREESPAPKCGLRAVVERLVPRDWLPAPTLRPRELAASFALLGAVGSYLLVDGLNFGLRVEEVIAAALVAVVTCGASGIVGAKIARTTGGPFHLVFVDLVVTTAITSVLAGGVFGTLCFFGGFFRGAIYGLFVAVPFLPAFTAVLVAGHRAGRARQGTLVADAEHRGIWRATALVSSVATGLFELHERRWWNEAPAAAPALLALLAALALLALDVRAWLRASRFTSALAASGKRPLPADADGIDAPIAFDFGLGDERHGRVTAPSYRTANAIGDVVLGDPGLARAALRAEVARSAGTLSVALGVAIALLRVWRR
jgi:hypothetical protein